ncbi:MAG: hypothetical protein AB8E82_14350 [Aureispira sp.]
MFGFLRKKPTIDAIQFPTFDWELVEQSKEAKRWIHPEQTQVLTVNFFATAPDLPTIQDIDALRQFFRKQVASANGGIIQIDTQQISGCTAIKTIFKFPQEPSGMTYLGSLIFPFKKYSYVVKIQAIEVGTTGLRESLILNKLMQAGAVDMGNNGFEGWSSDPYLADFGEGNVMNLSEAEAYDDQFAQHPLSQVREGLRIIEKQLILEAMLQKLAPFDK